MVFPEEDPPFIGSSTSTATHNKKLVRVEKELADERKKTARLLVKVQLAETEVTKLQLKVTAADTARVSVSKKHKADIEAAKCSEKSALSSATTSSK